MRKSDTRAQRQHSTVPVEPSTTMLARMLTGNTGRTASNRNAPHQHHPTHTPAQAARHTTANLPHPRCADDAGLLAQRIQHAPAVTSRPGRDISSRHYRVAVEPPADRVLRRRRLLVFRVPWQAGARQSILVAYIRQTILPSATIGG
jgi:hypothetical protein